MIECPNKWVRARVTADKKIMYPTDKRRARGRKKPFRLWALLVHDWGGNKVVLATDPVNDRVVEFGGSNGERMQTIGEGMGGLTFAAPYGIVHLKTGDVAVADSGYRRITVLSKDGLYKLGSFMVGFKPHGLAVDQGSGRLFASDCAKGKVLELNPRNGKTVNQVDDALYMPAGMVVSSERQLLMVSQPSRGSVAVISIEYDDMEMVKTVKVASESPSPFLLPGTGALVMGTEAGGRKALLSVDVESEESTVVQVEGDMEMAQSLCWVEATGLLWAASRSEGILRLQIDGAEA